MSLKPHQYMLSLNSSCSVFASQYYANICQNSLWDYWKKTTAWKVSAYFVFPVLLRFSSVIIALQIGKSSFQLWQVTIIPAFILISSGKKYNRSIWIRWFLIVFRCEDRAAPKKRPNLIAMTAGFSLTFAKPSAVRSFGGDIFE